VTRHSSGVCSVSAKPFQAAAMRCSGISLRDPLQQRSAQQTMRYRIREQIGDEVHQTPRVIGRTDICRKPIELLRSLAVVDRRTSLRWQSAQVA
jgi:hypothetical protein